MMTARAIAAGLSLLITSVALGDPAATEHVAALATGYAERGGSGAVEVIVTPRVDAEPQRAMVHWRVDRASDGSRAVSLQLGDLRLHAESGRGIAARGGRHFEWAYEQPFTPATLSRVLPEVPVMALSMSLGGVVGGQAQGETEAVDWLVLTRRDTGIDHVIGRAGDDLIGIESRDGVIERVVRQRDLPEPWTVETVRIGRASIAPGPIETEGATRVESLAELFAPPLGLVAGEPMPELGLIGRDGLAWEPYLACGHEPGDHEPGDDGLHWMVLAIVPADDIESATRAGAVLAADTGACGSLVARFDIAEFSKASRRATLTQWSVVVAEDVPIAWTVSDIAIGDGLIAVVTPEGVVAAVRALDADSATLAEWVRDQLPAD